MITPYLRWLCPTICSLHTLGARPSYDNKQQVAVCNTYPAVSHTSRSAAAIDPICKAALRLSEKHACAARGAPQATPRTMQTLLTAVLNELSSNSPTTR